MSATAPNWGLTPFVHRERTIGDRPQRRSQARFLPPDGTELLMAPVTHLVVFTDRAIRSRTTRFAALCVTAFTLAAGSAVTVKAQPDDGVSARGARSSQELREYRALRRMHAWSDRLNQEAWMDAYTTLQH